jgi:isoquinoline 1-oxidoreductase alpha subunit
LGEEITMVQIRVNGQTIETDAEPGTPLLWVLRDEIGLTGTKFGCGAGLCGACTVHVDGQATRSCITPVEAVAGAEVTTIEGLSSAIGRRVQEAWIAEQVPQCGYCQPGMIMAATALLMEKPRPSDTDINAAMTNLCRCGTYARIRRAIHSAANA